MLFLNYKTNSLHSAVVMQKKNLTYAILQPDYLWKMEINSLLLDSTLSVLSLAN